MGVFNSNWELISTQAFVHSVQHSIYNCTTHSACYLSAQFMKKLWLGLTVEMFNKVKWAIDSYKTIS